MDLSALEAYVMVCREGKMSRAAEKLFMSKQTLSMIIKRMENEMNAELLVRTPAGVEMTSAGKRFFEYARQILVLWKECSDELEAMKSIRRSRLNVGFGYMIWNFWTKEKGEAFERVYPEIELHAEGELSKLLLERLDRGELDLVFTCMQSERHAQYDAELVRCMDILVTMAQADPLAGKPFLTPQDLAGRKILYPDSGADFLRQFCQFMEALGLPVQSKLIQAGNFLRNLRTIREENGLKLTNSLYNSMVPMVDGFVSLPLVYDGPKQMPRVSIYALMPRGEPRNPAAERFIDFLVKQIDLAEPGTISGERPADSAQ